MDWYDKEGNRLPYETDEDRKHVEELLTNKDYRVVQQDYTPKKKYWVSTVWLGLDQNFFGNGTPIIFETMVFSGRQSKKKPDKFFPNGFYYRKDFEQVRYSTEAEALKGHKKLLKEYTEKEGK